MLKLKIFIICSLLCLIILSYGLRAIPSVSSQEKKAIDLDETLDKCAVYCEMLANASLFFVCIEKIEEEIVEINLIGHSGGIDTKKIEGNTYIYDYQLIKKGNKIEEKRILLEENGKKKNEENAQLKTGMFYSKRSVFGPVGLLSRESHDKYDYEILDEESISGREAIVLAAEPKSEMEDMPNYGKIWVDKQDFSILKIEVAEESLVGLKEIKEASKLNATPSISVTHFYDEVYTTDKNQVIHFPSQTIFHYQTRSPGKKYRDRIIKAKTRFTYDNYKFFTVDVEVKY